MNLCEDLHALAGNLGQIDTLTEWNTLLRNLTQLAKNQQADWSRPSTRALLELCGPNASVTTDLITDTNAAMLTCKVTVS